MELFESYTSAYWAIWVIVATLVAQTLIASVVKAKQPGAIPGKISDSLSHSSFVFRSHRTYQNSLENTPLMLATAFLALFCRADATWTAVFVWAFAIARLVHMTLYYVIATEKNPSPRSYFYLIGVVSNLGLLGLVAFSI